MNNKKLIEKIAKPVGIIAAFSLLILIASTPIMKEIYFTHKDEFNKYIVSFNERNVAYLEEIAGKIKSLPVNPDIVNKLQSDYRTENKKSGQPKKYLWLSSLNEDFIFGAPSADFQKLNYSYDKSHRIDSTNKLYRNRNKYIEYKLGKEEEINSELFQSDGTRQWWEDFGNYFSNPTSNFSTLVYDDKGKFIGELHLSVDDRINIKKYQHDVGIGSLMSIGIIIIQWLLFISIIILWFLFPTWVYLDAKSRDVNEPGIWIFLTLISFIFGLLIYLIVRPDRLKSLNCPQCGNELDGTVIYCPHCGYDLSNTICQQCKHPLKPGWQFCPYCRAEINSDEQKKVVENQTSI